MEISINNYSKKKKRKQQNPWHFHPMHEGSFRFRFEGKNLLLLQTM